MSRKISNFICRCKHLESQHVIDNPFTSNGCSCVYEFCKDGTVKWCQCKLFRLDNLEYLEYKYGQKTS